MKSTHLIFLLSLLFKFDNLVCQSLPTGPYVLPLGSNVCDDLLFFYDNARNRILRIEVFCQGTHPGPGNNSSKVLFPPTEDENKSLYDYEISLSKLYPNPTNDKINLEFSTEIKDGICNVYAQNGDLIFEGKINGKSIVIDLSSYAVGTYQVKVLLGQTEIHKKVIKE